MVQINFDGGFHSTLSSQQPVRSWPTYDASILHISVLKYWGQLSEFIINLDINDEKSVKAMQLSEYLDIVENRWKCGCNNV